MRFEHIWAALVPLPTCMYNFDWFVQGSRLFGPVHIETYRDISRHIEPVSFCRPSAVSILSPCGPCLEDLPSGPRRRGIGSKLLRNLCHEAEKSGIQKLSTLDALDLHSRILVASCGSWQRAFEVTLELPLCAFSYLDLDVVGAVRPPSFVRSESSVCWKLVVRQHESWVSRHETGRNILEPQRGQTWSIDVDRLSMSKRLVQEIRGHWVCVHKTGTSKSS